jgi:hypothetical protein
MRPILVLGIIVFLWASDASAVPAFVETIDGTRPPADSAEYGSSLERAPPSGRWKFPQAELSLGICPDLGLDRLLRGGELSLDLGFREFFPLPAIGLRLTGDSSLATFVAEARVGLRLAPTIALWVGGLLPLGPAVADLGTGRSLLLEPVDPPASFGLDAWLAEVPLPATGFRVAAIATLAFEAWRVLGSLPAQRSAVSTDSLSAFSLGFKLGLGARLLWTPGEAFPGDQLRFRASIGGDGRKASVGEAQAEVDTTTKGR